MKRLSVPVRFSQDELDEIDASRKGTNESRSVYIRRRMYAVPGGLPSTILESKVDDIDLKLERIERAFVDIKKNELASINVGFRLLNSIIKMFYKLFVNFVLQVVGVRAMDKEEIAELNKTYKLADSTNSVSYVDYLVDYYTKSLKDKDVAK